MPAHLHQGDDHQPPLHHRARMGQLVTAIVLFVCVCMGVWVLVLMFLGSSDRTLPTPTLFCCALPAGWFVAVAWLRRAVNRDEEARWWAERRRG